MGIISKKVIDQVRSKSVIIENKNKNFQLVLLMKKLYKWDNIRFCLGDKLYFNKLY